MTDATKRTISYTVTLALGVGLLVYGVEAGVDEARQAASVIIGLATGAAFLKRPKEQ